MIFTLQKDFAMATLAKTATSGTTMIPDPSSAHTSVNVIVRL